MENNVKIEIQTTVNAPINKVWDFWNLPEHIEHWYFASPDWHCPKAENDLHISGKFNYRMEAKDGSFGFDFEGVYENVIVNELIIYGLADGRKVKIEFTCKGNETTIKETFDPENENPIELQRGGWQAILDNFKKHIEGN